MYDYKQTLNEIHAHGRFSGTPCLDRMRALLAAVGNPQKKLKFVHPLTGEFMTLESGMDVNL